MKKILSRLIYVVVAAQVIWLAWNYHARSAELASSPRIRIATKTYDPRDLTRGYFQALNASVNLDIAAASSRFGASVDQSKLIENLLKDQDNQDCTYEPVTAFTPPSNHSATAKELPTEIYESFPLSTFWKKQESGLWEICRIEHPDSPEDNTLMEGETRIPMEASWRREFSTDSAEKMKSSISLVLQFPGMRNLRYYYPEDCGDFFFLLREKDIQSPVEITVDLIVRRTNAIIPTQMYLNGIPYNKATELLKQNKFPFREQAAP